MKVRRTFAAAHVAGRVSLALSLALAPVSTFVLLSFMADFLNIMAFTCDAGGGAQAPLVLSPG